MTATIVTHVERYEVPNIVTEKIANEPQAAESVVRRVNRGQLWERLAEVTMITVNLANVTDAQADRMHAVLYSPHRANRAFSRGSRAIDVAPNPGAVRAALKAGVPVGAESGTIVAGRMRSVRRLPAERYSR